MSDNPLTNVPEHFRKAIPIDKVAKGEPAAGAGRAGAAEVGPAGGSQLEAEAAAKNYRDASLLDLPDRQTGTGHNPDRDERTPDKDGPRNTEAPQGSDEAFEDTSNSMGKAARKVRDDKPPRSEAETSVEQPVMRGPEHPAPDAFSGILICGALAFAAGARQVSDKFRAIIEKLRGAS